MKKFTFSFGGDAGLIAVIVAILSLIVFPLPPIVIDMLLGVNITASVMLLMASLYAPNALSLSSFPSLLLFTTLFRLALNIASTKLILLHAHAGHIIEAFGRLVVGGNLVVGVVVFLIITIVQFIVIAKGSERVAEVGARFTLDAMPGKQMSIDADLRGGHLTGEEARRRRALLAMESQLHGGMDGAMKFVKGDAIAGLVITVINLVAGIVIGTTYHGMAAGDAANLFAVLSIGDSMVSQIPSLLICVSAGVIITRVADEHGDKPKSLGAEIASQLTGNSTAMSLAGGLLVGFALVPGFPWFVFIPLAGGLFALARRLKTKGAKGGHGADGGKGMQRDGAKGDGPGIDDHAPAFSCPVAVTLAPQLRDTLGIDAFNAAFEAERLSLQERLGLPFPGVRMWESRDLSEGEYEILVHDVPHSRGTLRKGKLLASDPDADMKGRCESGGPAMQLEQTWWLPRELAGSVAEQAVLSHELVIARHVVQVLHERAHQFLGVQEVQWVLERVATDYPGLIAETQKVLPLQKIAEVLRRLLEEQIPIRNMRAICESLIVWGPKEKDMLMLTEYVRGDLGPFLCHRATGGQGAVDAVLLDVSVEKLIREGIKPTPAGNFLALPPDVLSSLSARIRRAAGEAHRPGLAVVTSMDIRRYVRRIVETEARWLHVYSFQELGPQTRVQPLQRVRM